LHYSYFNFVIKTVEVLYVTRQIKLATCPPVLQCKSCIKSNAL